MKTKEKNWEYKDRLYSLKGNKKPLTHTIGSRHTAKKPLMYWDEEEKTNKEIRYATNQDSCFVDEQSGTATLGHIIFQDGILAVPKEQTNLQKLLSLYHPLKDKIYVEEDKVKEAEIDLSWIEAELQALNLATQLDIDQMEAILRVEQGSIVSKMTSKEIKRDTLLFSKKDPLLFLDLADDPNVELRNIGVKAQEAKIIKLSPDQRVWSWNSNGKKLMQVPFEENAFSALAVWFQTDEGLEVLKSIQKKLK